MYNFGRETDCIDSQIQMAKHGIKIYAEWAEELEKRAADYRERERQYRLRLVELISTGHGARIGA